MSRTDYSVMRFIVPKDFRKMVRATEKTKPVMESTQARLLRKYKQASIV